MRWQPWLTYVLSGLLLRCIVGLGPHSGMGRPPMFGDFEAQRHWLEITVNLPVSRWYVHGPDNDLQYWGLDYPPATALHSLALGLVARQVHPAMVELNASRGSETEGTKTWMRFFALVSDALTYIPAVCLFFHTSPSLALLALATPAFVVIDHGHFQFNCVYHGLVVLALYVLRRADHVRVRDALVAAVLFSLAINFKIMALYFAPAFFFYLLAWCRERAFVLRFCLLGLTVVATFALVWAPFFTTGTALNVLQRIFPYERGLFEDKVANFWCTLNLVVKIRMVLTKPALGALSFALTWLSVLPACVRVYSKPSPVHFLWALFTSSLGVFLFAFQVHEKTIMLPLVPMTLLAETVPGPATWFAVLCMYSMSPLLLRDGIGVASMCMTGVYLILAAHVFGISTLRLLPTPNGAARDVSVALCLICVISAGLLGLLALAPPPPPRLPDLWVVLVNTWSFVLLSGFFAWGTWMQWPQRRTDDDDTVKSKTD